MHTFTFGQIPVESELDVDPTVDQPTALRIFNAIQAVAKQKKKVGTVHIDADGIVSISEPAE